MADEQLDEVPPASPGPAAADEHTEISAALDGIEAALDEVTAALARMT